MDLSQVAGGGLTIVSVLLPYLVRDMPKSFAAFGIAIGICMILIPFLPVTMRPTLIQACLYSLGIATIVATGTWQFLPHDSRAAHEEDSTNVSDDKKETTMMGDDRSVAVGGDVQGNVVMGDDRSVKIGDGTNVRGHVITGDGVTISEPLPPKIGLAAEPKIEKLENGRFKYTYQYVIQSKTIVPAIDVAIIGEDVRFNMAFAPDLAMFGQTDPTPLAPPHKGIGVRFTNVLGRLIIHFTAQNENAHTAVRVPESL